MITRPAMPQRQRGVATLVVVMVLFFVVSLVAAYANRNLIFEQKTSANQSRSTLAFEAAEAGVEWALAQLNGGRIDDNCANQAGQPSFQQRYLSFPAVPLAPGAFIDRAARGGSNQWPTCVFNGSGGNGSGINCTCPNIAAVAEPSPPAGGAVWPAFRVWLAVNEPSAASPAASTPLAPAPALPSFVFVNSVGCTRMPAAVGDTCLDYQPQSEIGDGLSMQRVGLALRSALSVPPAAPITARGAVAPAVVAAKLRVVNTDGTGSGGITVNSGVDLSLAARNQLEAQSLPGTPGAASYAVPDERLSRLSTPATAASAPPVLTAGERMFVLVFGMKRQTYRNQPGLRVCASPCRASGAGGVNQLLADNPHRVIWVDGDLTVDEHIRSDAAATPTPADLPALIIVDGGTVTFSGAFNVYGFMYLTGGGGATSTINLPESATSIRGALVAEGGLVTAYAGGGAAANPLSVVYDRTALDYLRTRYGSWVRVPGAWRDFKPITP